MKMIAYYKCRCCKETWEKGVTTAKSLEGFASSQLVALEDLVKWHYCTLSEPLLGISDLVGIRQVNE